MTSILDPNNKPVQMQVLTNQGKVILRFSRPIDQIVLPPDLALQTGDAIMIAATELLKFGSGIKDN